MDINAPTAKVDIYLKNFMIRGEIVVASSEEVLRVSDILNDARPFIPLLKAEIFTIHGQKIGEEAIIIFRKDSVDFLIPFLEPDPKPKDIAVSFQKKTLQMYGFGK